MESGYKFAAAPGRYALPMRPDIFLVTAIELLLPKRERARGNIESGRTAPHADLASIRWIGAHCAVALAATAPEHISQHA
jgi:hypothetical protein